VRLTGARFVRNLVTGSSEDFTNAAWTKNDVTIVTNSTNDPNGNLTANKIVEANNSNAHSIVNSFSAVLGTYTYSVYAKKAERKYLRLIGGTNFVGTVNFDLDDGTYTVTAGTPIVSAINAGNGWWRCSIISNVTATIINPSISITTSTSGTGAYAGDGTSGIFCWGAQLENVSGQADQTASEYVSVGVLSAPFHGAGVNGCKYFTTNKDGSAISPSVLKRYLAEPSRVNNCLWGRDATNAAWTKSNVTAAKTATGLDNVANSASRLTAAANDATLLQLLTAATGTRTTSAWIKRVSGSGTVSITRNGGTGWTDITSSLVTGTWVPVSLTSDVGANPTVGLKMGTSGDVIDVDCFQDEDGAWRTSPILTTTAAVTRNADVLSYSSAFAVAGGSAACSLQSVVPISTSNAVALAGDANARIMYFTSATARNSGAVWDATNTATATGNSISTGIRKRSSRWGADLMLCADGTLGTTQAFDGSMGASTTMYVGCNQAGADQLSGNIGEVHIWNPTQLTDTQMQQVTT
jgi:hypothetical protein